MPDERSPWSSLLQDDGRRKAYAEYVRQWESRIGAFLELDIEGAGAGRHAPGADAPAGPSSGTALRALPFAVKDNIAVEGFRMTCGSRILGDFRVPYTATCVSRLQEQGAIVIGKTNLDEFGMGSSCDNSALARTSNPYDPERVPGGSSGGSAAAVAAGMVPFALGTDTGGSVRQPANFCGIYGLKPTYGAVSRFGLAAYASSLECAGVLARSLDLAELAFETMRGADPMDRTSLDAPRRAPEAAMPSTVAVIRGLGGLDGAVEVAYREALRALRDLGLEIVEIDLPLWEYVLPAYYTIATAEASANLARYTGIAYGRRTDRAENPEELIRRSRTEGFGDEVKLRVLLGTFVLRSGFQSRYYLKAQKLRQAIRSELAEALDRFDLLALPVFPTLAFPHGDSGMDQFQQKMADKFTCTANLAGLPALALPTGLSGGLPSGIQLMAGAFREDRLFAAARSLAGVFPLPKPPAFSQEFLS
ncbi:MAG TPA: amidase family protein [Rectinemataceae bacterium]|nr:amidase family protein [Rectinemataceae bacterium]